MTKIEDMSNEEFLNHLKKAQEIRFTPEEFIQKIAGHANVCICIDDFVNFLKQKPFLEIMSDYKTLGTGHYASYNNTKVYVAKGLDLGEIRFSEDENDFIKKGKL